MANNKNWIHRLPNIKIYKPYGCEPDSEKSHPVVEWWCATKYKVTNTSKCIAPRYTTRTLPKCTVSRCWIARALLDLPSSYFSWHTSYCGIEQYLLSHRKFLSSFLAIQLIQLNCIVVFQITSSIIKRWSYLHERRYVTFVFILKTQLQARVLTRFYIPMLGSPLSKNKIA